MITVTLDSTSQKETVNALRKFGKNSAKVIKDVVNRTAIAVETDAKNRLKDDRHIITSRLRSSIHAELKPGANYAYSDSRGNSYDGSLKEKFGDLEAVAGTNVDYAPHIEFGTKPHIIEPKRKKVLRFFIGGKAVFSKKVRHPGTRASSFLRWAAERQNPLFVKRMTDALNKLIG